MHILVLLLTLLAVTVNAMEPHICKEVAVELAQAVEDGTLTELEAEQINLSCRNNN